MARARMQVAPPGRLPPGKTKDVRGASFRSDIDLAFQPLFYLLPLKSASASCLPSVSSGR